MNQPLWTTRPAHLLLGLLLIGSTNACKKDEVLVDCAAFHWSYTDDGAPEYWVECNPDCDGNNQSPINITGAVAGNTLSPLETHYEAVPVSIINNGHTIEFEYEPGSVLSLNGADYELLQFHFHTGSEHNIEGEQFPMEIHLVHKKSDAELAVIGMMVVEGSENAFLKNFSDHLPANENDDYTSADLVNVSDLFPAQPGYYTYGGSLTTPACSETVTWFVMKDPIQASAEQISNFHTILQDNFRPLQPLNGRTIGSFD